MNRHFIASCLTTLVICSAISSARAQTTQLEVPLIVRTGFDSLKASGFKSAVAAWMRGSPAEDPSIPAQLMQSLGVVLEKYGPYQGYDIVGVVGIGEHVRRIYAVALFDRGPVYASFDCYSRGGSWIIPGFLMNAQAQMILPPAMLTPTPSARP